MIPDTLYTYLSPVFGICLRWVIARSLSPHMGGISIAWLAALMFRINIRIFIYIINIITRRLCSQGSFLFYLWLKAKGL
jgi:hypothetical protein